MLKAFFLSVFFLITLGAASQVNTSKNSAVATEIKDLYNNKKYNEIYLLLSTDFKKKMSEKEFSEFMLKNIFNYQRDLKNFEFLKDEKDHSQFIGHFANGNLLMKLNVNSSNQINLLQFLPHSGIPRTKVTDYASDNKKATGLDSLIDKITTDYMQSPQNCGLSIGVYVGGKEFFYDYGETKRATKLLPAANTIYEIGSVTKAFCGVLLATAIVENKVKATDDIRLYLPEGKFANLETRDKHIQLIQLANHTSGLPRVPENIEGQPDYDILNPYKHYDKEMIFNYLQKIKLNKEPGTICEYSNLGMGLLGIILEKVYGKSFEELVKEKISKPSEMNNTVIALDPEQSKLFTTGYNSGGNETPHWDIPGIPAAGALKSNSKDMLLFLEKNLEEKDEAFKLSHQSTFNSGNNVAMGWHIIKTKTGNTLTWHNGGTFGSSSFIGFIKEKNCAVVVLSNSAMSVDPLALGIFRYLQK